MPNMGVIKEIDAPPKGILTRVMITVLTAANFATFARVIICDRSFEKTVAGFNALKAAYKHHVWDSNITGTLDIPISTAGKKIDRIFENGGLDYENRDDDGKGETTGWTPHTDAKKGKLYVYIEINSPDATLNIEVSIKHQERA